MSFALHSQLASDCLTVTDLSLNRVLLMNDSRFPWLILVPMQEGAREIFDLDAAKRQTLMEETAHAARVLHSLTQAYKMNIAALGNQVPQLHLHVIARFEDDAAWPNPVWGCNSPARLAYPPEDAATLAERLARALRG